MQHKFNFTKSISFFFVLAIMISLSACKKEKSPKEIFDLKNYVVHSVYKETNGAAIQYKAPQQLLLTFKNNQTTAMHVGVSNTTIFPINKTSFTIYDPEFSDTNDSILVSIDTINKTVETGGKYGITRLTTESNLIDVRENNWDLNGLKLAGKVEMRNAAGTQLSNPTRYVVFNNDASKLAMQETAPTASIIFTNTVYFGKDTYYYREANRDGATFQERLFLVFLKQKVILTGYYSDYVTHNVFYYYGELQKL
jgi:hypothetical protein